METHRFILDALVDEWRSVTSSSSARQSLDRWRERHAALSHVGDLDQLLADIRHGDVDSSSEIVWNLLHEARADQFARRVVLQLLIPGLRTEAGGLMAWANEVDRGLVESGEVDQVLIGAAWEAIGHAVGYRRSCPLKSILRRTHRLIVRECRFIEQAHKRVDRPDELAIEDEQALDDCRTPAERLLLLLGDAASSGTVTRRDAQLVWLSRVEGAGADELEQRFGASYTALRQRRHRAERRLAAMAMAG